MSPARRIKNGSSPLPLLVIILAALCAAAILYFVFRQPSSDESRTRPISEEMQQQLAGQGQTSPDALAPSQQKNNVTGPVKPAAQSPQEPTSAGLPPHPESPVGKNITIPGSGKASDAAGPDTGKEPSSQTSCPDLTNRLKDFFSYLDDQQYLRENGLSGESLPHFRDMAARLFATPPIIEGETDSLFTILQNTAHLYRVLGKQDLFLLKDIITRETPRLEHDFALFYAWSINDSCGSGNDLQLPLPFDGVYEYASFLLNTLGGQSYLFRRETHLRVLAAYYSILVIDLANDRQQNRHHIDLTQPIATLTGELAPLSSLEGRDEYLRELRRIAQKPVTAAGR